MDFDFEDGLNIVKSLTTNVLSALRNVPPDCVEHEQGCENRACTHTDVSYLHRIGNFNKHRKKGVTRRRNSESYAIFESGCRNEEHQETDTSTTKVAPLLTIKLRRPTHACVPDVQHSESPLGTGVVGAIIKRPSVPVAPNTASVPCTTQSKIKPGTFLGRNTADVEATLPSATPSTPRKPHITRTSIQATPCKLQMARTSIQADEKENGSTVVPKQDTLDERSSDRAEFDNDIKFLATVPNKMSTPVKQGHSGHIRTPSPDRIHISPVTDIVNNILGFKASTQSSILQLLPSPTEFQPGNTNDNSSVSADQSSGEGLLAPRLTAATMLKEPDSGTPCSRTSRRCLFMNEDEEAVYYLIKKYLSDR